MNNVTLQNAARAVIDVLTESNYQLVTVESCTGGWVGKIITDLSGSSTVFAGSFVTYSNEAKQKMVGVSADTLAIHGAVSEAVAAEMSLGAMSASLAQVALSITGVAGPTGGSEDKPVGMVCFSWSIENCESMTDTETCYFEGDRDAVRQQAVLHALQGVVLRLAK